MLGKWREEMEGACVVVRNPRNERVLWHLFCEDKAVSVSMMGFIEM